MHRAIRAIAKDIKDTFLDVITSRVKSEYLEEIGKGQLPDSAALEEFLKKQPHIKQLQILLTVIPALNTKSVKMLSDETLSSTIDTNNLREVRDLVYAKLSPRKRTIEIKQHRYSYPNNNKKKKRDVSSSLTTAKDEEVSSPSSVSSSSNNNAAAAGSSALTTLTTTKDEDEVEAQFTPDDSRNNNAAGSSPLNAKDETAAQDDESGRETLKECLKKVIEKVLCEDIFFTAADSIADTCNHILSPVNYVRHFVDLFAHLGSEGVFENNLNASVLLQKIQSFMKDKMSFRWVIRKCKTDSSYSLTAADGYCGLNLSMQLAQKKFHPTDEEFLANKFPMKSPACMKLLEEEQENTIPFIADMEDRKQLAEHVRKMLNVLSERGPKNRPTFTDVESGVWMYPNLMGFLFTKNVPMMLFVSELFEKEKKSEEDTAYLYLWKDSEGWGKRNFFSMNDLELLFANGDDEYAGCFKRGHYFYYPKTVALENALDILEVQFTNLSLATMCAVYQATEKRSLISELVTLMKTLKQSEIDSVVSKLCNYNSDCMPQSFRMYMDNTEDDYLKYDKEREKLFSNIKVVDEISCDKTIEVCHKIASIIRAPPTTIKGMQKMLRSLRSIIRDYAPSVIDLTGEADKK